MKKRLLNYLGGMALIIIAGVAAVYFVVYTVGVPTGDKPSVMYGAIIGATAVKVIDVSKKLFAVEEGQA